MDNSKDYSKIIGYSFLSILKFASAGILLNWAYGLYKVSLYTQLFMAGGWQIALALLLILLFFAGIPALYFFIGMQSATAKAIKNAFEKNQENISTLINKVAVKVAGITSVTSETMLVTTAKEYRLVQFIVRRMGFKKQWGRITGLKTTTPIETKAHTVKEVVDDIVTEFPQKLAKGFSFNFTQTILINIIVILFIELLLCTLL